MRFRVYGSTRIPGTPFRVGASFPAGGRARPRRVSKPPPVEKPVRNPDIEWMQPADMPKRWKGKRFVAVMPRQLAALFWVFIGLFLVGLFFLPLLLLAFPVGVLLVAGLIHHAVVVARAERLNKEATRKSW